ncbi:site-specific DNA-methyltransferase [Rothia sp. ZJ1223]|uniref:site-specific DNA-methyltransferase n=1 Tax=Rothia sp. ZJ1223 TaxID=2811098 RepID=UPI00195F06CE|nr:site-specific DNA-methyltransferase [Rothia sp. ZJ1223]MBM7051027.1 site-specific DNA-methyltransferase [Rothia sp. ZJ1223]
MPDQINEVPATTPNFTTEAAAKLAELFPEIVADGKVNLDALRALIDEDAENPRERFGLTWPGKTQAIRAAQTPTTATLAPDKDNSVNWDTTQNVFIEGDNLEVLKVLQKHYYGQIKMIYIDPPYNTGNDFVYSDDYADPIGSYLEITGQADGEGKLSTNSESAGRFHSNWLNMMYPRLKLARNLLHEDGVIFINIGEKEQAHLQQLCNQIFGETNFIADFIWEKSQHFGRQKTNSYSNYDHIFCYGRKLHDGRGNKKELLVEYSKTEFEDAPLYNASNPENTLLFRAGSTKFNLPDGIYDCSTDEKYELNCPVVVENGHNSNDFELTFRSRWSRDKVLEETAKGTTFWVKSRNFAIRAIYADGKVSNESPKQIIFTNPSAPNRTKNRFQVPVGTNEEGSSQLKELLGGEYFSYPKPSTLIEYLVSLTTPEIVLDFFAGSGTTAHAVMALNAEDGGNRRCISVQLPEPTPEDSVAREQGFELISEITRERIRRAGTKILTNEAKKLDGRADALDVGFRAYRLVDTNFAKWELESGITEDGLQQALNLRADSSSDDAAPDWKLTEILLKLGFSLSETINEIQVSGLEVFSVEGGLLLAYMNEHVPPTLEQLRALVAQQPAKLVVLEDAFHGNDELKTNLVQECRTHGVDLWTA